MMKRYLFFGFMVCWAASASAQVSRAIDKARKDPQTMERAAKADARLIDLKKVTEEQQQKQSTGTDTVRPSPHNHQDKKKKS